MTILIIIYFGTIMAEHPSMTALRALTNEQIRGFTRDQALQHQGLSLILTADQCAQC